jgi:hypothetical protein
VPLRSTDVHLAVKALEIAQIDRGGASGSAVDSWSASSRDAYHGVVAVPDGRSHRNRYLAARDERIFLSPVMHRVSRGRLEGVRYE